jgi:uncharacterized membrane protein YccC
LVSAGRSDSASPGSDSERRQERPSPSLWRTTARIDREQLDFGGAFRCTLGVLVPLVIGAATGALSDGVAAAVGALCTGFASFQGAYRSKAALTLVVAAGMAVSTVVGALSDHNGVAEILVAALWGGLAGMMVAPGQASLVTGLQWAVAVLIVSAFPMTLVQAFVRGAAVFVGGAMQTLLVVVIWPFRSHPRERRSLGAVYQALAALADAVAGGEPLAPGATTIDDARAVLADPQPFGNAREEAILQSLLDEAERIRIRLSTLGRHSRSAPTVVRLASLAARVLRAVGSAVSRGDEPQVGPELLSELDQATRALSATDSPGRVAGGTGTIGRVPGWARAEVASSGEALSGQLRSVVRLASALSVPSGASRTGWRLARAARRVPAGPGRPTPFRPGVGGRGIDRLRDALHAMRANLSWQSAVFRHAVRLAVTLGASMLIYRLSGLPHGYWIGLTSLVVLRPDFSSTAVRGLSRVAGTILGAVLASLFILWLRPGTAGLIALFTGASFAAYVVVRANYLLFSVCVTSYVVFLLAFAGLPSGATVEDRLVSTVIGGTLALGVYMLWPTWESRLVGPQLADLVEAQADYAGAVLAVIADPRSDRRGRLSSLRATARLARSNAEASLERFASEPLRSRRDAPIGIRQASGILAAARRSALAVLGLHLHLPGEGDPGLPEVSDLSRALAGRMRGNAARLRTLVPVSAAEAGARSVRSVVDLGRHLVQWQIDEGSDAWSGSEAAARPASPSRRSLRELHGALQDSLAERLAQGDQLASVVASETDTLVDAVDVVAELLGRPG